MSSSKPLKVLWLIPKWTLPATDGARVATERLLVNTVKAGARVDVVCLTDLREPIDKQAMISQWHVRSVSLVPRSIPITRIGKIAYYSIQLFKNPLVPLTFSSFVQASVRQKIGRLLRSQPYDVVVLDGLHLGAVLMRKGRLHKPRHVKVVYRAHNLEQTLWSGAARETSNPVKKLFLSFQYALVKQFEQKIVAGADGVAAISQDDIPALEKLAGRDKAILHIPLGLDFNNPLPSSEFQSNAPRFLFIGRLDWPPNRDGLAWLLREIWPAVIAQRPGARLYIAGSGNASWLSHLQNQPGLHLLGFVREVKDAYSKCDFAIVPMRFGSGTRIKVMEAVAMGRPLISTRMGVQGSGLSDRDYLCAESRDEWIDALTEVELDAENKAMAARASANLARHFDQAVVGRSFYRALEHWSNAAVA